MSKHALEAFAACLLQELKPFGLAVSIVQPGAVATRIGDSSSRPNQARLLATPAPFDVGARQVLQAGSSAPTPRDAEPESASNRRPAAPEAVAAVVLQALFDAAPQARYLVGTPWEGRRVVDALIERLLDAAQSPGQQLDRTSLIALIDAAAARRAQRPW